MSSGADSLRDWGAIPGDPLITYSHGVNARSVAEWALASILYFFRDFDLYTANAANGKYERRWARELSGRSLLVLGAGAAGSELAVIASSLGMHTTGVSSSGEAVVGFDRVVDSTRLDEVLPDADIAVVLLPLSAETRGFMNESRIRRLKPGSLLIAASRGGIVDERAVLAALDRKHLCGAVFDVLEEEPLPPDSRLWSHSRTLVTPHVAGTTDRFMEHTAAIIAKIWRALSSRDTARISYFVYD
jgi:phosphoglycerate dehydrogenase-like enzyme